MTEQTTSIPARKDFFAADSAGVYLFLLACGVTAFYEYFRNIVWPGYKVPPFPVDMYTNILIGNIESPYAYRVLVPLLIKAMVMPLTATGLIKLPEAFFAGYTTYCFVA